MHETESEMDSVVITCISKFSIFSVYVILLDSQFRGLIIYNTQFSQALEVLLINIYI